MIKINNNIYFKGIEQIPNNNQITSPANPIRIELGEKALPVCDKSLAIKPIIPSELINESDITRYKAVQKNWAESLSQKAGIPVKNIMSRLPEVKPGDAKAMTMMSRLGQFEAIRNIIEINPIREMANLFGGDESKIIHELTHGFFHNVRRAYAKQIPLEQLWGEAANIVGTRMLQGEHGLIIKEFKTNIVDGQTILTPELMIVPSLSAKERTATLNTLNSLQLAHIDPNTAKLNDAGIGFIRETLLPHLTDYSQQVLAKSEEKNNKICEKMVNYIDSFFTRRNLLIGILTSPANADLEENLQTPLTEIEQNMARNSFNGLLSTQEGNYIIQQDSLGISANSAKSYFMSYEELVAREEESIYRLEKVNKKITGIESKGLKPSEKLIQERNIAETNLKLLNLTRELDNLEKQIIGSEKNPEKLIEISKVKQDMIAISEDMAKFNGIYEYINLNELKFDVKTEEDFIKIVEEKVPSELRKDCAEFFDKSRKIGLLISKLNELDSPEKLLADTPENSTLKSQFDNLMTKIREISPECDVLGIPKQFFRREAEFLKTNEKVIQCVQKWAKRIK